MEISNVLLRPPSLQVLPLHGHPSAASELLDADGYPIQTRGVTRFEGLYFLGMPWLYSRRSGLLFGVGEDAAFLAEHMAARASQPAGYSMSL